MTDAAKQKRILIADDEAMIREMLAAVFKAADFYVYEARNGEEALIISYREHPDIIILDNRMPVKDGLMVLSELRKDNWGKDAKVIMFTGFEADDPMIEKMMEYKPAYYFVKNKVDPSQVLQKIKEILGG